jgi:hypothetical protein
VPRAKDAQLIHSINSGSILSVVERIDIFKLGRSGVKWPNLALYLQQTDTKFNYGLTFDLHYSGFQKPIDMFERFKKHSHEISDQEKDFLAMTIISPDIILRRSQVEEFDLEVPETTNVDEAWKEYRACGGRIYIQNGDILDHKTVTFRRWLLDKGSRPLSRPDDVPKAMTAIPSVGL